MTGNQLEFYRARADQARAEAEAATLTHVRDRCRRSEAAWTVLADRAERSERLRAEESKRKAELLAADNAEQASLSAGEA